jgi:hypothetical protein
MDKTSSLNEACVSCVPSASLASILQKILVSFAFLSLGQTNVAVANMIKSCIQINISHAISLQDQK